MYGVRLRPHFTFMYELYAYDIKSMSSKTEDKGAQCYVEFETPQKPLRPCGNINLADSPANLHFSNFTLSPADAAAEQTITVATSVTASSWRVSG
jgi:hypothetical protein